jgi:hypothetical protein
MKDGGNLQRELSAYKKDETILQPTHKQNQYLRESRGRFREDDIDYDGQATALGRGGDRHAET